MKEASQRSEGSWFQAEGMKSAKALECEWYGQVLGQ